ncbi:MAG: ATP phosphoribosyltransferase [Gammaproteobacteria bacterium]|nr:MAG: ATP phosphoribosyltransferase [Gammaproteobacteria bacterium]
MNRIRVAVQKSGRLSERSLELLQSCGLRFVRSKDKLYWYGKDFPVDLLLVRDDDIPRMLLDGVCELGIVGENIAREEVLERNSGEDLTRLRKLSFGDCRLSLAVPEDSPVKSASDLDGCRIATSYPALTSALLAKRDISAEMVRFSGSVEIAPGLGIADAISDLVSTGTTLRANHLVELEVLFESTAALYGQLNNLTVEKRTMLDRLLARLDGVLLAVESKYVMLNAPRDAVAEITRLLPGAENPSLMNLEGAPDRVALHAVCRETVFWEHLEALKGAGASAILVLPVEKMLA